MSMINKSTNFPHLALLAPPLDLDCASIDILRSFSNIRIAKSTLVGASDGKQSRREVRPADYLRNAHYSAAY